MFKKGKKILFLFIVFFVIGCGDGKKNGLEKREIPAIPVGTITAKSGDIPITFNYPASIISDKDINVVAKVSGTLMKKNFNAGERVREGDVLFLIDDEKYRAAYEMSKANLSIAKANLKKATLDFNRGANLKKTDAISQKEYEALMVALDVAKSNLDSAKAQLLTSEIDLNNTQVKAPFSGVIGDSYKSVGAYISLSEPNLVRLAELNPLYAKFFISDTENLNIDKNINSGSWKQLNSNATIHINGIDINGTVDFIDRVIDRNSGSIMGKVKFNNNDETVLPGAFANVTVSGFIQKNGFRIPQIVIQQDTGGAFVYIYDDGKVKKSRIKITYEDSNFAVVSSGIKDNDEIISDNFIKIRVGSKVTRVKE